MKLSVLELGPDSVTQLAPGKELALGLHLALLSAPESEPVLVTQLAPG